MYPFEWATAVKKARVEADAARFSWFFGNRDKGSFVPSYMRGLRKQWTLDQWRAAIDEAMRQQDEAEDVELNRKLKDSINLGASTRGYD